MASKYWIKIYVEILDDPKMGRLSRSLRYRVIEMLALAGDYNQKGLLPPLEDMAWRLRENIEILESDLIELAKSRILDQRNGQWHVVNFEKRQAPSTNAKRVQEYRKRKRNADVTKSYASNAPESEADTESETESYVEAEAGKTPPPLPRTPLEASQHPDIVLFRKVSGMFPGMNDYREIVDAATILRRAHPDETELESYLLPFWLRWQGMKRKDGKAVNLTNPTWFVEWAVNNYTPSPAAQENSTPKAAVRVQKQEAWTPESLAAALAKEQAP